MELYLVRHATSTRRRVGAWGRLVDSPLDVGYEQELADTRDRLADVVGKQVYSSPLIRCTESARFVCPGLQIEVVDELRAYHSGLFENATVEFVDTHHEEYARLSYRDRFLDPKFGEESIADQAARVAPGLLRVLASDAPAVVVATHYSTINIIAHAVSGNWDHTEYGDGVYDVVEGGLLHLSLDKAALVHQLAQRLVPSLGW